jgi:hypothetical protein
MNVPGRGFGLSRSFRLLLGFHVFYSQLLLHAAKIGVTKTPKAAS